MADFKCLKFPIGGNKKTVKHVFDFQTGRQAGRYVSCTSLAHSDMDFFTFYIQIGV